MTIDRLSPNSPPLDPQSPPPQTPPQPLIDSPESLAKVHSEEFLPAIYPWNLWGWLLLLVMLGAGVILMTFLPLSVTRLPTIAPPNPTHQ